MPNKREIHFEEGVDLDDIVGQENTEKIVDIFTELADGNNSNPMIVNRIHQEVEMDDQQWTAAMILIGMVIAKLDQ